MAFVKLLKNHNGQEAGTTGELSDARANYLVRVGVAELVTNETEPPKVTTTKKVSKKVEPCKSC